MYFRKLSPFRKDLVGFQVVYVCLHAVHACLMAQRDFWATDVKSISVLLLSHFLNSSCSVPLVFISLTIPLYLTLSSQPFIFKSFHCQPYLSDYFLVFSALY